MAKTSGFNLNLSTLENTPANREELKKIIDQMEEIDALKRELGMAGQTEYHGVSVEQLKSRLSVFEEEAKREEIAAETLASHASAVAAQPEEPVQPAVAAQSTEPERASAAPNQTAQSDQSAAHAAQTAQAAQAERPSNESAQAPDAFAAPQDSIEKMISSVSDDMDELKRLVYALQSASAAEREGRDSALIQRILRTLGEGGEDGAFAGVSFTAVEYLRLGTPDRLTALLHEVEKVLKKAALRAEEGKIRASKALVAGLKRHLRPVMLSGSRAVAQLRTLGEDMLISSEDLLRVEGVFATFESLGKQYSEQDLTAVLREKIVTFGNETMIAADHEVCAILAARAFAPDSSDGEIEALKAELTSFPLSAALRFDVERYAPAQGFSDQAAEELRALKSEIESLRKTAQSASEEPAPITAEELRALKEEIASLRKQLNGEEQQPASAQAAPAEEDASAPPSESERREGVSSAQASAESSAQPSAETAAQAAQKSAQEDEFIREESAHGSVYYFEDEEDFVTEVPEAEEEWVDPAEDQAQAVKLQNEAEADLLSSPPRKKRTPRPRKTVEVRPIARQKAPFKTKQVHITATSAISEEMQKKIDEMEKLDG